VQMTKTQVPRSAALAAKERTKKQERRLVAVVEAEESQITLRVQRTKKRTVTYMKVTGGKSKKTGMVLARAQLEASTGGVVAAQQRQNSLLGKGRYRDAETLAREAPVGTLRTKDMPKRKQAKTKAAQAAHGVDFRAWMDRTFQRKPKQTRTAAGYEKMVLTVNDWMVEQGYEAFAHVVQVTPKRYRLQLRTVKGKPQVPSLEAIIEFVMGMASGDVEKGGSRAARAKDWYASPLWGRSQADMFMRDDQKGAFGWGAHKDTPYRMGRIESHVTALRQWLSEQLMEHKSKVVNPMHDGWIDAVMGQLRQEVGCGRVEANLPPTGLTAGRLQGRL